jgi:hypothetical protein
MRKLIRQISLIVLLFITLAHSSFSQSIEETLSNISSGAVIKYTEPVIDAFGSSMNSGWFTGLPSSSNGIHAKLRVVGIGSFFSNNHRTFTYNGDIRFTSQQVDEILNASGINPGIIPNYEEIKNEILSRDWEVNFNGPTITGNKNDHLVVEFPGAVVSGQNINSYAIELEDVRGYLDNIDLLPSPALQFDLGSVLGTGVSVRYFRGINLYDLGIVDVWGAGFTHNLNYWFEEALPIEIGFGYYFQDFKVGDIFQNTASQYGLFISKKLGGRISIEPYASLTYETSRSQIDYKYHFDSPLGSQELQLNIDYSGDSTVNLAVGTSINLSLFMINFDYKFGGTNTGTVGVGFGF